MPNEKFNFTKAALANLPMPAKGKRNYYSDTQVKGLVVAVQVSGAVSFYVYKKIAGKPERIFLGIYPDLSVENARKLAKIKIGQIAEGSNPQEELRLIRNEMTLGDLFEQYMTRYSKLHKKSWKYDEREIPRFLSKWFKRRLSDIKKTEVQYLHELTYIENGLYQANRILERVRALYNKAIEWGWEGTNPALGIKKYKEKSRDRFIQPAEMPCIIQAISEEANITAKDFLWLLLLTGARKTNTLMMRWEELSWERSEWRIPDTKNGEPVIVPLVPRAVKLLSEREKDSNSTWVFPQDENTEKHFVNHKRAWKRILQRATIIYWKQNSKISDWVFKTEQELVLVFREDNYFNQLIKHAKADKVNLPPNLLDIRIHDIRRTFGSYQAITGASLQIIGKSLGHRSTQSTQIYARLNLDPVRAAVEKATNAMFDF